METETTVSFTIDQAISKQQGILNRLLVDFDKWASRNPDKLMTCKSKQDPNYLNSKEYYDFKQEIKLAKLRLHQLEHWDQITERS